MNSRALLMMRSSGWSCAPVSWAGLWKEDLAPQWGTQSWHNVIMQLLVLVPDLSHIYKYIILYTLTTCIMINSDTIQLLMKKWNLYKWDCTNLSAGGRPWRGIPLTNGHCVSYRKATSALANLSHEGAKRPRAINYQAPEGPCDKWFVQNKMNGVRSKLFAIKSIRTRLSLL